MKLIKIILVVKLPYSNDAILKVMGSKVKVTNNFFREGMYTNWQFAIEDHT